MVVWRVSLIPGLWRLSNMRFPLWTLSCSLLPLLASTVDWLLFFFFLKVSSRRLHSALVLHWTLPNTYVVKAQPRCHSCPPLPRNIIPTSSCNEPISDAWVPERKRNLTFWVWPLIDISKRDIRAYTHPENRSLIQSLTLMRLAIKLQNMSRQLIVYLGQLSSRVFLKILRVWNNCVTSCTYAKSNVWPFNVCCMQYLRTVSNLIIHFILHVTHFM